MTRGPRNRRRGPAPNHQVSFLPAEEAEILHLVRENLRLLAEIRPRYGAGRRSDTERLQVRSARDVFQQMAPEMEGLLQEQLKVLLLDSRNRLIDAVLVYQGNVGNAVVRMAELVREAVIANAPAMILVHNHPSGDPEPSPDDVQLTKEAAQAAALLSIELLDHVIVGHGRFVSLKERGAF
jgi:DNA repair protein RadC